MKLKRDSKTVLSCLVENKSNQVLTKVNCKIQVPVRFSTRGLGQIGINTFTYGCFAIILETGEYSVCNVAGLIELNPSSVNIITIDDVEYYEFSFDANTVVIKTTYIVKRSNLMYSILDEFIFKGKIPWYMSYDDLGKIYDTAKIYAGSNVGQNQETIEFLASIITRSKKDRTKYLRTNISDYKETENDKIDFVPLNSVFYSVNSTVNRLAGNYFNDGVISSLVIPTDSVETIEAILRA